MEVTIVTEQSYSVLLQFYLLTHCKGSSVNIQPLHIFTKKLLLSQKSSLWTRFIYSTYNVFLINRAIYSTLICNIFLIRGKHPSRSRLIIHNRALLTSARVTDGDYELFGGVGLWDGEGRPVVAPPPPLQNRALLKCHVPNAQFNFISFHRFSISFVQLIF